MRLLGYPMFENMLSAKPDMMLTPVEDLVSRSNIGWLRLLHLCLSSAPNLEHLVCGKVDEATMLLCTRLLSSPAMVIYDKILEVVLVKLSKHDLNRSLEVTRCLLQAENGLQSELYSVPHGVLMETLVNILYQINEVKETNEEEQKIEQRRVNLIIEWLKECVDKKSDPWFKQPSNMLLHCVACILHQSRTIPLGMDEKFVSAMVSYANTEHYTKQAVDWLLCVVLEKEPKLLDTLTSLIDFHSANFLPMIETLSYAIQSPSCMKIFLDSKFFAKFCSFFESLIESGVDVELSLIKVFVAVAGFECGQKWLGSEEGCSVWQKLVHLLCSSAHQEKINYSEETCILVIQLVKKMLFCHAENQAKFASYVTRLIRDVISRLSKKPSISGFLHQLILQVIFLLNIENYLIK